MESIQRVWLQNKSVAEIKHRFKNLTCARVPLNPIKQWKLSYKTPLSDSEIKKLAVAVKWFGEDRWPIISQLLLPDRSPHHLKMEYYSIINTKSKAEYFAKLLFNITAPEQALQQLLADQ